LFDHRPLTTAVVPLSPYPHPATKAHRAPPQFLNSRSQPPLLSRGVLTGRLLPRQRRRQPPLLRAQQLQAVVRVVEARLEGRRLRARRAVLPRPQARGERGVGDLQRAQGAFQRRNLGLRFGDLGVQLVARQLQLLALLSRLF